MSSSDTGSHPSRHHAPPTRSLLIMPLLALCCISWLVVSEVGYLLPFSRIMKARQENEAQQRDVRPWRVIRTNQTWVLQQKFTWHNMTTTSEASSEETNKKHKSSLRRAPLKETEESDSKETTNEDIYLGSPVNEQTYLPGGAKPMIVDTETRSKKSKETSHPDQAASTKSSSFDKIVLLGERHSGTSYTTRMLAKCFPSLDVSDFLVRYKHWFQPTPDYVVNATKTFLQDNKTLSYEQYEDMHKVIDHWPKIASLKHPKSAFHRTLVIVMFRNVYDWLEAMRLGPHHMPNHFTMYRFENAPVPDTVDNPWYGSNYSSWRDFLAANMTIDNKSKDDTQELCQNAYHANEVSPCRVSKEFYPNQVKKDYPNNVNDAPDDLPFNGHNPIYELRPNGEPFDNILELRTAKIRNFMDIPKMWDVGGFMTLQHEDVNSKGSGFLLDQVSKIVGMEPSCGADPPKNQTGKVLEKDWEDWISQNADWEAEGLLGYKKRDQ